MNGAAICIAASSRDRPERAPRLRADAPRAPGEREEHDRRQRGADEDHVGRREHVVERDLDEQVGRAPEGRREGELVQAAAAHPPSIAPDVISSNDNLAGLR